MWLRVLTDRPANGEVLRLIGIGALPVLAVALVRGWLAVIVWPTTFAVALMLAAGEVFGVAVTDARPADPERDFFGPVIDAFDLGLRDFYDTKLPFDRISHPEMASLVLLSLFLFVAITGSLIAARRLTLASGVLLVAVGWPATMIANVDNRALAVGTILLAVVLLVLYLARSRKRPLGGVSQAAVLGAVLVLVGVGLSSSKRGREGGCTGLAWLVAIRGGPRYRRGSVRLEYELRRYPLARAGNRRASGDRAHDQRVLAGDDAR